MKNVVLKFLILALFSFLLLPSLSSCYTQRSMSRTFNQWYLRPGDRQPRTIEEARYEAHRRRMRSYYTPSPR